MIPNRAPSTIWAARMDLCEYVRPVEDDRILICAGNDWIEVDRPTARLLAKRINECLDATVKR